MPIPGGKKKKVGKNSLKKEPCGNLRRGKHPNKEVGTHLGKKKRESGNPKGSIRTVGAWWGQGLLFLCYLCDPGEKGSWGGGGEQKLEDSNQRG